VFHESTVISNVTHSDAFAKSSPLSRVACRRISTANCGSSNSHRSKEGRTAASTYVPSAAFPRLTRILKLPLFPPPSFPPSGLTQHHPDPRRARAKRRPSGPEHPNSTRTAMAVDGQVGSGPRAVSFDAASLVLTVVVSCFGVEVAVL
jgi:hypothetical protein